MEATQYSKLLADIPEVDIVITMGCNVQYSFLPCSFGRLGEDPTGKNGEAFLDTIRQIEGKSLNLKCSLFV